MLFGRSLFSSTSIAALMGSTRLSAYAVNGFDPALVFDFDDEYYRTSNSKTTFESAISHNSTTATNGTMVDSDGLLKWRPHNLLTYSEQFDNVAWVKNRVTVTPNAVDGTADVITTDVGTSDSVYQRFELNGKCTVVASFWGYNGTSQVNIGLLLEGASFVSSTATVISGSGSVSGTGLHSVTGLSESEPTIVSLTLNSSVNGFLRFYIYPKDGNEVGSSVAARDAHAYRSDLGGMVNNPDRGDSYVPTTDSPRYLPRRGHHVYNGSTYVNEGLLVESESRTNLITDSEDFTAASWGVLNTNSVTRIADQVVAPDGTTTMDRLEITDTTNETHGIYDIISGLSSGSNYCFSCYVKSGEQRYLSLVIQGALENFCAVVFDILSGTATATDVGTTSGTIAGYGAINCGNGIYRIWLAGAVNPSSGELYPVINFVSSGTPTLDNVGRESYAGTAGDGFYVWGAQFEQGKLISAGPPATYEDAPTPSSYIPTNGATATRGAETLTVAAADLPYPTPLYKTANLVDDFTLFASTTSETGVSDGTLDFSGGVLTVVRNTTDAVAWLNYDTSSSKVYEVTYRVVSGIVVSRFGSNFFLSQTSGTYTRYIGDSGGIRFWPQSVPATIVIDNISVREIDPLSVSLQMDGRMTYADTGVFVEANHYRWGAPGSNLISAVLNTQTTSTGKIFFQQQTPTLYDDVSSSATTYSPGILVPYNISSRHGSTFVNGAVDGVEIGEDITPTALPDLSATNLSLAHKYNGTIRTFRMWNKDLTDTGIEEASEGEPSSYLIWDASADTYISKVYD